MVRKVKRASESRSAKVDACIEAVPLHKRRLLSPIQAAGLAAVFKVLGNDTRIRILHALIRADELCVTELSNTIGMKPQAVSNQIQRLAELGIVDSRREGNNIHYRVVDVCTKSLLEKGLCLMEEVSRTDSRGTPCSD
jgi:ArsR family transcriptional regulator, lead/cadmium/zinc/bismuth-responsive transcriptional repressor